MKILSTAAALFLSLTTISASASDFEFAISDDFFHAALLSSDSTSRNELALSHTDTDGIESDLLGFGIFASGNSGHIRTYIGGRAFYLDAENGDMRGVALGGGIDMNLAPKILLSANAYYAPDIITGGDFDNYTEFDLRVGYQLLNNASIFAGYRFMEAENNRVDFEIYDGAFIGFRFPL